MSVRVGKDCKVTLGSQVIVGMGDWDMPGVTTDLLDATDFGDDWKIYEAGLKDGGEITFNGLYDPADTLGQGALRSYNNNGTHVTSLRLYIDSVSYWTPTTQTPVSYVLITQFKVSASKADLMKCSFTARICGKMELI